MNFKTLAEMCSGVVEALSVMDEAAFEFKLDGARIQIHREESEVRIFSRRLTDVTNSLPEIVRIALTEIQADRFILEGEVVAFSDHPILGGATIEGSDIGWPITTIRPA